MHSFSISPLIRFFLLFSFAKISLWHFCVSFTYELQAFAPLKIELPDNSCKVLKFLHSFPGPNYRVAIRFQSLGKCNCWSTSTHKPYPLQRGFQMCVGLLSGRGDFLEEVVQELDSGTSGIIQPECWEPGGALGICVKVLLGGEGEGRQRWEDISSWGCQNRVS